MRNEFLRLQIPLPIAIVGLGISGEATRQLLISIGVDPQQILTFDQKSPADYQDHQELLAKGKPRSLCISPGVPLKQDWIQKAIQSGLRLTSEMEIAFAFLDQEKVISITGSVGKSTTTSILGAGALRADSNVFIGGNLGTPLADYSRGLIDGTRSRARYVILELSSYQLENFKNLKTHIAVLTYLNANHLERYASLDEYYQTKIKMFQQTVEVGVLNGNGGDLVARIDEIQKTNPKLKWVVTDREDLSFQKKLSEKPKLVGTHNLDNLAVAFAVAENLRWPPECYQAMLQFPGLSHRLENCGSFQNILFLNDSKATTMDSVLQAVRSVREEYPSRRILLTLGGKDKNLPWIQLADLKNDPNLHFSFFGEVGSRAQLESALPGQVFPKLVEALQALKTQLKSGDILLFSPGGTSWDEFKNFEDRGSFFKKWVLSEFQD